jgi:hypothetical protein
VRAYVVLERASHRETLTGNGCIIKSKGFENNVVISTLVATPFDIQYGLFGANPILKVIEKEGASV